jgi:hypothetical protein
MPIFTPSALMTFTICVIALGFGLRLWLNRSRWRIELPWLIVCGGNSRWNLVRTRSISRSTTDRSSRVTASCVEHNDCNLGIGSTHPNRVLQIRSRVKSNAALHAGAILGVDDSHTRSALRVRCYARGSGAGRNKDGSGRL